MNQDKSALPIGIFDSGIGGLTVTKAIVDALPNESIIYFGDTAHLPYGDKSQTVIQAYCIKIVDMLLAKHCKSIVIACHSASAAAHDLIKKQVGNKAVVVDVIDPMIKFLHDNYANKKIGLIGTRQTIKSGIYDRKINDINSNFNANIEFKSLATPLLVPVIEEGYSEHVIMDAVIEECLSNSKLQDIDALILGCTHYPVVRHKILNYYNKIGKRVNMIDILDSASIVAQVLRDKLQEFKLLNKNNRDIGNKSFYVSDLTEAFKESANMFFTQAQKTRTSS